MGMKPCEASNTFGSLGEKWSVFFQYGKGKKDASYSGLYVSMLLDYITDWAMCGGNFSSGLPPRRFLPVLATRGTHRHWSVPHAAPIVFFPWATLNSSGVFCNYRGISELPIAGPSGLHVIHAMDAKVESAVGCITCLHFRSNNSGVLGSS